MRYFICPDELLPRLCTIEAMTTGHTVVWTVFDFMEQKNSLTNQTVHKPTVDRFIKNVLMRLQKFKEVDEISFTACLQQAADTSQHLARSGLPQTIWTPSDNDTNY